MEKSKEEIVKKKPKFRYRAAEKLTVFCGTWTFIFLIFTYIGIWIGLNVIAIMQAWDPYPFIVLNLTLSCLAAIQAPIILMGQSVAAHRDRIKSERDFAVNRKAEREVEDMQKDLDEIKKLINRVVILESGLEEIKKLLKGKN